jgi:putative transposase
VQLDDLTTRKLLPHHIPTWIDHTHERYFLTICCEPHGKNQLAFKNVANSLFETVAYRNKQAIWSARLVLLMPDHVHFLISFPDNGRRMQTTVSKWKEWTSKKLSITWQRNFFEHRLRHDESARQKADYILFNPVRFGLVSKPEDWPFVFIPEQ